MALDTLLRPAWSTEPPHLPLFSALVGVVLTMPTISAEVRRLHDTGRSGWFLLIQLVPLFGRIALIAALASPGTPGANRYGPPPADASP